MAHRNSGPGALGGLDEQRAKEWQRVKDLAKADEGEERSTQRPDDFDKHFTDTDAPADSASRGRGGQRRELPR